VRISRTRHFKINLGNYESYEFGSSVTLEHGDIGLTDEEAHETPPTKLAGMLTDACLGILNDQLAEEIEDARNMTKAEKTILIDSFAPKRRSTRRA
jgi:hypothetical protein